MILSRKKKPVDFIESVTRRSTVLHVADKKGGLEFLVSFFSAIRPFKEGKDPSKNLQVLIRQMDEHPMHHCRLCSEQDPLWKNKGKA